MSFEDVSITRRWKYISLGVIMLATMGCIYMYFRETVFNTLLIQQFKVETLEKATLKSVLVKHPSLALKTNLSEFQLPPNAKELDVEQIFVRTSESPEIACPKSARIGNAGDGGWNVCEYGNFSLKKPCLVYSFGINNDWSFDDGIVNRYGCMVRSFDPSMNTLDTRRNPLNVFFKEGLGGKDIVLPNLWRINTLKTLHSIFQDGIIDYLKFDIEGYEWESLNTSLRDGSLLNVKQMAFEIHTDEAYGKTTPVDKLRSYLDILDGLRELGFYRWYAHTNPLAPKIASSRSRKIIWCCHEIAYVNLNFV